MISLHERASAHMQALHATIAAHEHDIQALAATMAAAFASNHRVFFFGNGGSACDAMHIAGEFVGRFVNDRRALPAIALTADSGILTAVANDYSYDVIFARQLEALCRRGDTAIGLSTSGSSPSVLRALETAEKIGASTVLFTGEKGRGVACGSALKIIVPTHITAHIQEVHMFVLHTLAAMVEHILKIDG